MSPEEQIDDLRTKLRAAGDERDRQRDEKYEAQNALIRAREELEEVQFHRSWNLRVGALLLLVFGTLGVSRACDGRARGERARANAERAARTALVQQYPAATISVTCRESNLDDPNCRALVNGVRLQFHCDDDEPRANDGCGGLP